ncbi:MAG: hypothetical protein ACKPKO_35630, partial [Candidatus Fonsibacter sp.]
MDRIFNRRREANNRKPKAENGNMPGVAGASMGLPLLAQGRGVPEVFFTKNKKTQTLNGRGVKMDQPAKDFQQHHYILN